MGVSPAVVVVVVVATSPGRGTPEDKGGCHHHSLKNVLIVNKASTNAGVEMDPIQISSRTSCSSGDHSEEDAPCRGLPLWAVHESGVLDSHLISCSCSGSVPSRPAVAPCL